MQYKLLEMVLHKNSEVSNRASKEKICVSVTFLFWSNGSSVMRFRLKG